MSNTKQVRLKKGESLNLSIIPVYGTEFFIFTFTEQTDFEKFGRFVYQEYDLSDTHINDINTTLQHLDYIEGKIQGMFSWFGARGGLLFFNLSKIHTEESIPGIVAHEAFHFVEHLIHKLGLQVFTEPDRKNPNAIVNEHITYLLQYIVDQTCPTVVKQFKKLNKKK
jgi:hypothetical protein